MTTSKYHTDLSDAEWECLEAHLPTPNKRGSSEDPQPPPDPRGGFLRLEVRLSVEIAATRLPTMEDRLPLLPRVAPRRDLGATTHRAARAIADKAGKKPRAQCGHSGCTIGQDDRGGRRSAGL